MLNPRLLINVRLSLIDRDGKKMKRMEEKINRI